jgi:nucleoside-diphosphate-sugar epimerase
MSTPEAGRVAVFGATGKIGRLVVEQLLAGGYEVSALARNPAKLTIRRPGLSVRSGQLYDLAAVREVVRGSGAVISTLGPSLRIGASGAPVTAGTCAIVAAVNDSGVRRFVGLATPSVADPRDRPTFKARLLPVMAGVMFPNALIELGGMTAAVTGSGLDWTIARITNPTDRPARGTLRAGFLGRDPVGWAMSRAYIAAFLIGQLTDTTFLGALPAIRN